MSIRRRASSAAVSATDRWPRVADHLLRREQPAIRADFRRRLFPQEGAAITNYSIEQTISAPFGDDPVLISQATITNHGNSAAPCAGWNTGDASHFNFPIVRPSRRWPGIATQTKFRREMGRRFSHQSCADRQHEGSRSSQSILRGRSPQEEAAWARAKAMLRMNPNGFTAPVAELKPGTEFESLDLPQTFLVSLDGLGERIQRRCREHSLARVVRPIPAV